MYLSAEGTLTFVDLAWEKRIDDAGGAYFYNPLTGLRHTSTPDVFPEVMAHRAALLASPLTSSPIITPSSAPPLNGLKAADSGDVWMEAVVVPLSPEEVTIVAEEEEEEDTEPVWSVHLSKSKGALYYFNRCTGVTQVRGLLCWPA